MKIIEYYYNLIYYFFYRGFIKASAGISIPVFMIYSVIYKIPLLKKRYARRGINNPLQWHKERYKQRILENPSFSLGTMYGGGLTISSLAFILIGFYKIVKNFLFPDFQDSFGYLLIIFGLIAYTIDNLLVIQQDQGEKYIKKFNKIKDKSWRRKWAFITALTFPLSTTFMVMTSKSSYIGGFLYAVHQYLFH